MPLKKLLFSSTLSFDALNLVYVFCFLQNVKNVGTSTNRSGSIKDVNTSVSEDYLKQIRDLKEDSFSLDVLHETSELSFYIDRRDLSELISGDKWISTSI